MAPGRGRGRVVASRLPLSFLGGVDRANGRIVDPKSDVHGKFLRGRVFAFPHGTGSTVGSYVMYGLAKRGKGPAGIVADRAEAIVAVGAVLGNITAIDGVDTSVLETGDEAIVDGSRGTVTVPKVQEQGVVTAFLRNRGRILVLRRSRRVGSFRGRWSGISGYLEGSEATVDRARIEIAEETAIRRARLVAAGRPRWTRHGDVVFRVHPFLFEVASRAVRLDWENVEARWLPPASVATLNTVPRLADVLADVLDVARRRRTR